MNFQWKPKKILILSFKVIGWTLVSILGLLVLVALSIQIPFVQNKIVQEAVGFLHGKIGTEVRLDHISLSIPKKIVLTGLYLEDQSQDTLLYAGELAIDTDLYALTRRTIQLNNVELTDFHANVSRAENDSAFNFDYIIKAFAGNDSTTVQPDTTQQPWKFSVGDVALEKISLKYQDDLQGNDVALKLGKLNIEMEEFDLDESIIKVDEIEMADVMATVVQSQVAPDTVDVPRDTTAQVRPFDVSINEITFANIRGDYNNSSTGQVMKIDLGDLSLEAEEIDLAAQKILLSSLELQNTAISIQQMAGYRQSVDKKQDIDSTENNTKNIPWHIALGELQLSNNSFEFNNFEQPAKQNSFDPNRIRITGLETNAEDLEWRGNNAKGTIILIKFADRSGFIVNKFATEFAVTDNSLTIEEFLFNTPNTTLTMDARASFTSLESLSKTYPQSTVDVDIDQSTIGWKDIAYFISPLSDSIPVELRDESFLKVDTEFQGKLENLTIDHLTLQTLTKTYINASGTLRILKNDFALDVELEKFYTTKNDVLAILADSVIPPSIALPQWLNLRGHFKGTMDAPEVKSVLTSDFGTAELNAILKMDKSSALSRYKANLKLRDFDLGRLLRQEKMGKISLTTSINGSGTNLEELNSEIDLQIHKFLYSDYLYKNFTLNGKVKKFYFDGTAKLQDENLTMRLDGELDYNAEVPKYHFDFELKNADFKALHLSERPLRARGTLNVDLATADFKVINGKLGIRKFAIYNGEAMYAVDSLLFASIDQQGQSEISIRSDIIDGNFEGTINLYSLSEVLRRHFNNYFSLHDVAYKKPAQPQNFKFDLKIKDTDLITEILVPELDPFVPGRIAGEFDSNQDRLDLGISLAKISYTGFAADSITFDATSDKNDLTYSLALRKIKKDTMRIEALRLDGKVAHDSIRTKLIILDSLQKEKYVLGGVFNSLENVFQFRFLQDEVVMNYAPWTAPPDNSLQFTADGLKAHNFSITNINERISVETRTDQDSIVAIVFKDLNLQNITKLIEGTTPIDGLANGDFKMVTSEKGAFNSTLRIDNLEIFKQPWGDLSLALGQTSAGPLNIDLRVEGDQTELKAAGYYQSDPTAPEINFTTTITKLNLAAIEPLTMGQLKNTKGQLTGEIKIIGRPSEPDINGKLTFKDATFTPTSINSQFLLEDETITVTNDNIIFDDFEIKDKDNSVAKVEGTIKTSEFSDFDMNLNLSATDFQILNSTDDDNELFYGNVSITTKAKITGNLNQPNINMNINLSDESDFTYVVPQSEKGVLEQTGIVEWIDRDAKKDPFLSSINPKDTIKSTFKGINLSANIELNDKETFNIIIDPLTGDKLSVKGNSTLTLDIDPTGDMVLSGRYEITEGSYDLSFYRIVKRKFLIEKGGSIIWAGNPTDATLNIRAIYEVETSPMDLLADGEDTKYKQRLPFLVYLQIKGEMLTPEISFQLDMPEDKRNALGGGIYARIRDINTRESELNKQVFALLVLKRFISDNPLDNKAGSDVASGARRSASKLLSEQLNRLSENIKGVELTFDVKSYEDYSSGSAEGQTQVQLGLSKSLLDDRLIVKVSGNVEVEGETSNQSSVSDYIGDLALEYKLTTDGRFRITGFRNTNYDMINGELMETGIGLIYIKDYNTLRELFKANVNEK